jgi:hypothetical protein
MKIKIKKPLLIWFLLTTIIGFVSLNLGEKSWKKRVVEIRNNDYVINGKIIKFDTKGRGVHLILSSNQQIYTNAFVEFEDSLSINDSIYKPTRSNWFYYYKLDSIKNKFRLFDSSDCTTLSFE